MKGCALSVEDGGEGDACGHGVGVHVGGWAAVFHVALAILGSLRGDADGCSTISHTSAELVDLGGLVLPSEAQCVVLSIDGNVLLVALAELLDGSVDLLESSLRTHLLGGEVGVASSSVPVACDGLGVERDDHTELLSESVHDEARDPHVVSSIHTNAWANLVLPLAWHDLSVDPSNLHASVQASSVVSLNEGAAKRFVRSSTAVVGTLRGGETSLGPSKRCVVEGEESVLLLDTEPWLEVLGLLEDGIGWVSCVGWEGGAIGFVSPFNQRRRKGS